jgi:type IV secretory pathway protease TraF
MMIPPHELKKEAQLRGYLRQTATDRTLIKTISPLQTSQVGPRLSILGKFSLVRSRAFDIIEETDMVTLQHPVAFRL